MNRLGLQLCVCGHPLVEHERSGPHRCLAPKYPAQRGYLRGTSYTKCKCRSFQVLNSRPSSHVEPAEPEVRANAEDAEVRSKAATVPVEEALARRLETGQARVQALRELEAYLGAVRASDRVQRLQEAACA